MLQGIERYLKQAIVDKNPAVSSAALVSSVVRVMALWAYGVLSELEENAL
jgi:hypothetical protein